MNSSTRYSMNVGPSVVSFGRQCHVSKSSVRITQDISFRVHAWKRRRSGSTLRLPCMCTGRNRQVSRTDDFETWYQYRYMNHIAQAAEGRIIDVHLLHSLYIV